MLIKRIISHLIEMYAIYVLVLMCFYDTVSKVLYCNCIIKFTFKGHVV